MGLLALGLLLTLRTCLTDLRDSDPLFRYNNVLRRTASRSYQSSKYYEKGMGRRLAKGEKVYLGCPAHRVNKVNLDRLPLPFPPFFESFPTTEGDGYCIDYQCGAAHKAVECFNHPCHRSVMLDLSLIAKIRISNI